MDEYIYVGGLFSLFICNLFYSVAEAVRGVSKSSCASVHNRVNFARHEWPHFLLLLGTVFTIVRQRRKKNLYTCSATWDNHKFVYVHARINSNCNLQEFLLLKIPGDLEVGWFPWEQRRTNTSTSFFDLALRYSSVPTNGLPSVHLPQNKPCAQSSMA